MKRINRYIVVLGVILSFILCSQTTAQESKKKFVVVLDAGHGGHDSGNRGNGYIEKNIALKVVLGIGKELEKDPHFKVVYTRKTDKFIELHERGKIANKAKADLFVSIHCNAHHSQASGTETFVLGLHANDENFNVAKNENSVILLEDNYEANYDGFDPNSPESIIGLTLMQEEYLDQSLTLASYVQSRFKKSLKKKSRGVKQAGFVVLHQTYMPSVLIELGFLTNIKEGKYLNSKIGQKEMSASIIKSIKDYKKSLDAVYFVEDPVSDTPETTTASSANGIAFKVQIAAGTTAIALQPQNFKGLKEISKIKNDRLYKYYYGNTPDYNEAQELRKKAVEKGYDSSFIVAFKGEQIISIKEALKANSSSN
ncbi:N-acetylmuramoyl-L-alanine amidase [Aquimarina hainanensis]|uniref:N-acetylmuramoyl-L-alanine amidase n=1 Tax=Aquimarina hainanensis TaxID=1578017 RepID=A0ABW5NAM8_9FLAO|nr:N-acetylmuramoyl-L-alanine amidase [Aquimarina sp. TRL1]QKX06998.1 N-acetylmuramoyl-L-alanine amidase [Aquimarina sp. TRL1]